jgi:hypothetical protein
MVSRFVKDVRFRILDETSAGLQIGNIGAGSDASPWVTYAIAPVLHPDKQTVYLDTGPRDERFTSKGSRWHSGKIPGTVRFRLPPAGDEPTSFGSLSHRPAVDDPEHGREESYHIEAWLPPAAMDNLWHSIRDGRPPIRLGIYTAEIDFGIAPDGSDRRWNIEEKHSSQVGLEGIIVDYATADAAPSMERMLADVYRAAFEKQANQALRENVMQARTAVEQVRGVVLGIRGDLVKCGAAVAVYVILGALARRMGWVV